MNLIICPNCDHRLTITVDGQSQHAGKEVGGAIDQHTLDAVLDFMRDYPGRYLTADLWPAWNAERERFGAKKITQNAWARAMRRNGATRWRTAQARGYDVPVVPAGRKAAPVATTVAEAEARARRVAARRSAAQVDLDSMLKDLQGGRP